MKAISELELYKEHLHVINLESGNKCKDQFLTIEKMI